MDKPLVSIVVLTYNSEKYVLETLESARNQTYSNIELIVTDDCSADNTVKICRDWLAKEGSRFVRAELVTSPCNTGIPANANRGYKIARGEWIKGIAGDDILNKDAIEQFLKSYNGNHYIVATSYKKLLAKSGGENCYSDRVFPIKKDIAVYNLPVEKQYQKILWYCFVTAPTVFFKRDLFEKVGYFDEQYRLMEDWPFWLKCLEQGYKIDFFPILTVCYRINCGSVTFGNRNFFYNENFYITQRAFMRDKIYPRMSKLNFLYWEDQGIIELKHWVLFSLFKNRRNFFTRILSFALSMLSPIQEKKYVNSWLKMKFKL